MTSVLFETLWHDFSDGWSIASRVYARALKLSGLDVQLRSWMGLLEQPSEEVMAEVGSMLDQLPQRHDLYLFSCTLSGPERASYSLEPLKKVLRPRAFYTMFERCRIEPPIAESLNDVDGVMVPCSANLEALLAAGCRTATYVPYPYFPDDPHLTIGEPRHDPRIFYWIGRWEPRKAPHTLVRAFLRAFRPGEARLLLKIGHVPWRGYPEPEEAIADALTDPLVTRRWFTVSQVQDAIKIIRGRLSQTEMLGLHARGDVYVSASRGEGIDLPVFAAKLAGRRVVTTDSGGPRDFLTETDILVPKTGEVLAPADYRWGPEARLADYDLDALTRALQVARSSTKKPERISDKFHVKNVAMKIKTWVEEIVARVPREAPVPRPLVDFATWLEEK